MATGRMALYDAKDEAADRHTPQRPLLRKETNAGMDCGRAIPTWRLAYVWLAEFGLLFQ